MMKNLVQNNLMQLYSHQVTAFLKMRYMIRDMLLLTLLRWEKTIQLMVYLYCSVCHSWSD